MPIYRIPLEKEYQNKKGRRFTLSGHLDVEATSATDAMAKYKAMVKARLQTVDERIVWHWEDSGWTLDSVIDKGYEYVDWSFGIPSDEAIELAEEDKKEDPVILTPELKSALVTALQVIDKLNAKVMDWVLTEIDLNDDAWEEELNLLKAAVNWEDDDDDEEDEED